MDLVGKTVKSVRTLTEEEASELGWSGSGPATTALEFHDGSILFASSGEQWDSPGILLARTTSGSVEGVTVPAAASPPLDQTLELPDRRATLEMPPSGPAGDDNAGSETGSETATQEYDPTLAWEASDPQTLAAEADDLSDCGSEATQKWDGDENTPPVEPPQLTGVPADDGSESDVSENLLDNGAAKAANRGAPQDQRERSTTLELPAGAAGTEADGWALGAEAATLEVDEATQSGAETDEIAGTQGWDRAATVEAERTKEKEERAATRRAEQESATRRGAEKAAEEQADRVKAQAGEAAEALKVAKAKAQTEAWAAAEAADAAAKAEAEAQAEEQERAAAAAAAAAAVAEAEAEEAEGKTAQLRAAMTAAAAREDYAEAAALKQELAALGPAGVVSASMADWSDLAGNGLVVDVVLASEVLYDPREAKPLARSAAALLSGGGTL